MIGNKFKFPVITVCNQCFVATAHYVIHCSVLSDTTVIYKLIVNLRTAEPPYDCWEHLQDGGSHVTGVHNVRVETSLGLEQKQVYCDMDTDGGG